MHFVSSSLIPEADKKKTSVLCPVTVTPSCHLVVVLTARPESEVRSRSSSITHFHVTPAVSETTQPSRVGRTVQEQHERTQGKNVPLQ